VNRGSLRLPDGTGFAAGLLRAPLSFFVLGFLP
jgi:hypothetical protein